MNGFGWESSDGGSVVLADGILQLSGGVPLDVTLRAVTDQLNTPSPLYLSSRQVGISAIRNSVSNNDSILDITGTFTSRNTANDTLRWGYVRPSLVATASGQTLIGLDIAPTFTPNATSDTAFRPLSINYVINNSTVQSGTATGIYLNATETALNGMTHNLIDLQVGGNSKFKVARNGDTYVGNDVVVLNSRYVIYGSNSSGTAGVLGRATGQGIFEFNDASTGGSIRINLGGATNAYSAIKRNGTGIDFRLADDSDYAGIISRSAKVRSEGDPYTYVDLTAVGGQSYATFGNGNGNTGEIKFNASDIFIINRTWDATGYKVGGTAGVSFSGAVANITVVNGIVTAAS